MKEIPLTKGQFAIVDDWWYDYLMQWKWFAHWSKITNSFYAMRNENGIGIHMHRIVSQTPANMFCDHIHHKTLDNRESELRNVTRSQNQMNQRVRSDNKTGIPGVVQRNGRKTYTAHLKINGKNVLDKSFPTIEQAIEARRSAEKKFFGEFAKDEC